MHWKSWLFGLMTALTPFGTGVSAPLVALDGHVLALDVRVAGKQVMTPIVELVANAPALVEVQGAQPNDRYSLRLLLRDGQSVGKIDNAISIEVQLSAGDEKSQVPLASMTLFIQPGKGGSAAVGSERGEIVISVLSHALKSQAIPAVD